MTGQTTKHTKKCVITPKDSISIDTNFVATERALFFHAQFQHTTKHTVGQRKKQVGE